MMIALYHYSFLVSAAYIIIILFLFLLYSLVVEEEEEGARGPDLDLQHGVCQKQELAMQRYRQT